MHLKAPRIVALAFVALAVVMGGNQLAHAIDAGAGTPPFPIDPSRALTTNPLYTEDIDLTISGDRIFADPQGPDGVFYVDGKTADSTNNGPHSYTPMTMFWGTGSLVIDSGPVVRGLPGTRNFSVSGATCASMISNNPSTVDTHHDSTHATVLIIECGLEDLIAGASAATTEGRIVTLAAQEVAAGWKHVFVNTVLDSPLIPTGSAAAVNTLLRAASISPAVRIDVDVDLDVDGGGPYIGMAAGAAGGSCLNDRSCWYSSADGGVGDGTLLRANGSVRYAYFETLAIQAAGFR